MYGTGIASETLFTSATELPVCPDTQASLSCLYVFAMVVERVEGELDAVLWSCLAKTRCGDAGLLGLWSERPKYNVTSSV